MFYHVTQEQFDTFIQSNNTQSNTHVNNNIFSCYYYMQDKCVAFMYTDEVNNSFYFINKE